MRNTTLLKVFLGFLTLCSVSAKKHSSSARVAFLNFVSENEATSKNDRSISPSQLNTAIKRVMSLDAEAEFSVKLPAGDMFNKPTSNIVLFIDGIGPGPWDKAMPYLREVFHTAPTFMIIRSKDSHQSIIQDTLENINLNDFAKIHCDTSSDHLFQSNACFDNERSEFETSDKSLKVFDLEVKASQIENVWMVSSTEHNNINHLKINSHVLSELSMLSNLSNNLKLVVDGDKPEFHVLHFTSLIKVPGNFGEEKSMKFASGIVLDHAVRSLMKSLPSTTSVQIVLGDHLSATSTKQHPHGRRLQTTNSTNSTSLDDIKQYQLNLWTGVFLVLMVLMAIYGIVSMDIGRDSLLYAKFQADTSGKND